MGRRFVVNTWNNAAAPKKVKPVVPLHHLISSVEAEFDKLDENECELDKRWICGNIPLEQYERLKAVLWHKRQKLSVRRDKEDGTWIKPQPSCYNSPPGRSKPVNQQRNKPHLPNWLWWLISTIIFYKMFM